jgi:hypothetical protein
VAKIATVGEAKAVLREAYGTLAELAATDLENPPTVDGLPRKPNYWVGRMQADLFAMAEMFQALLADAEKNAPAK